MNRCGSFSVRFDGGGRSPAGNTSSSVCFLGGGSGGRLETSENKHLAGPAQIPAPIPALLLPLQRQCAVDDVAEWPHQIGFQPMLGDIAWKVPLSRASKTTKYKNLALCLQGPSMR